MDSKVYIRKCVFIYVYILISEVQKNAYMKYWNYRNRLF